VHDYTRLRVWNDARALVLSAYELSNDWPRTERFGLVSQIRRAAVSIPANIAEGAGRGTNADFARFVRTSIGSVCEVETLSYVAEDLGYATPDDSASIRADATVLRRRLKRLESRLTGSDYAIESTDPGVQVPGTWYQVPPLRSSG
jgi:four helix bundle protein